MNVKFYDRQDGRNPLNGLVVAETSDLLGVLNQLQGRAPFFCELLGDNGYKVLLGLGGQANCVQYSSQDGNPPYLMAVSQKPARFAESVEFLFGGTLTPVPSGYYLPFETALEVAAHFQMTGERSPAVTWEEI